MQYYRGLLQQATRIEAFRRAIRGTVRPSDRVLDIGTGLGTYAFFAAAAGAARVWAVDGNPVVHVAQTVARMNGYAGSIDFVRGWIPDVAMPERATVLIFEDFPSRLLDSRVYRLFSDLHRSYLAADARTIPARALSYLAPVTGHDLVGWLGGTGDSAYGIDWSCTREYAVNTPRRSHVRPDSIVSAPALIGAVDFTARPETWHLGGCAAWLWENDVVVSGLAYWFDLELSPSERLSNAPGAEPASWGQLLLPLDPPVRVAAGAELSAEVTPETFPDGAPGWLRWSASTGEITTSGHEFGSAPASLDDLYAQSPDAKPRLSTRGAFEAEVLRLTDGTRSVGEIADRVLGLMPGLTPVAAQRLVVEALHGKLERVSLSHIADTGG